MNCQQCNGSGRTGNDTLCDRCQGAGYRLDQDEREQEQTDDLDHYWRDLGGSG